MKKGRLVIGGIIAAAALASTSAIALDYVNQEPINDFTLMVYMNGSDLESKHRLATDDLEEITQTLPPEGFEIVILTGGTKLWHNKDIDDESLSVHTVTKEGFRAENKSELGSIGKSNTLTNFITYTIEEHPAEKYGLLFWNHGNGSVNGFGFDELYDYDSLTLPELEEGLKKGAGEEKFAFIGFDACLMANVEVATAIFPYADYLIASQELEPGEGWDYSSFLPMMYEAEFDIEETLKSMAYDFANSPNREEMRTLSVIDLRKLNNLNKALDQFSLAVQRDLKCNNNFMEIAKRRSEVKAFGQPGFLYKGPDMIDIQDMTDKFKELYPVETKEVKEALEACVITAHGNEVAGTNGGLSIYFPYQNKKLARSAQDYYDFNFNKSYQNMLIIFMEKLLEKPIKPEEELSAEKDQETGTINMMLESSSDIENVFKILLRKVNNGYIVYGYDSDIDINFDTGEICSDFTGDWLTINGIAVSIYTREHSDHIIYTSPVLLNGEIAEIIITYDDDNPQGIVSGIRMIGEISGKGYVSLKKGDIITLLYEVYQGNEYYEGETIVYSGDEKSFHVDIGTVPAGEYRFGFSVIDFYQNQYYSNFYNYSVVEQ